MGSCVSSPKHPDEADIKFRKSYGSKTDKAVMPSPIKDNNKPLSNGDLPMGELGLKPLPFPPTSFRDFGSKEEAFFDSQAWLDSDCDDDFLSVNGEFTPSRGNTPIHHSIATGTPRVNKAIPDDSAPGDRPELPSTDKKRRLSDLFKESLRGDQVGKQNASGRLTETPNASGEQSSERTPNGYMKPEREKSTQSLQCCLPSLTSSRSFSEGKRQTSPVHCFG